MRIDPQIEIDLDEAISGKKLLLRRRSRVRSERTEETERKLLRAARSLSLGRVMSIVSCDYFCKDSRRQMELRFQGRPWVRAMSSEVLDLPSGPNERRVKLSRVPSYS